MSLSEDSTDYNDIEVASVFANVENAAGEWKYATTADGTRSSSTSTSALDSPVMKSNSVAASTNDNGHSEETSEQSADISICQLAARGELMMLQMLINEDNMNQCDDDCWTALMHAVNNGWLHVVKFLLNRGVDMNLTDNQCATALMHASCLGLTAITRVLLNHGASVNDVCLNGNSALHYAVFGNHVECVQLLLNAGIDITIENCNGATAVELAAQLNHREAQDLIFIFVQTAMSSRCG